MFEWTINERRFQVRQAHTESDFHEIEEIQREAWGFSDLDIVPMAHLVASGWAGGICLCAFEGDRMIGFVYGFPGYEQGRASIHSHMLAVRRDSRNFQAGFYLKLAQRQVAIEKGIDEITWTFDPLQSLNAHLNFNKLGVVSRRYIVNFYGEASSSPLHQGFGTDRLWVNWLLTSDRVKRSVERQGALRPADDSELATVGPALVVRREGDYPRTAELAGGLTANRCLIEIPHDITALKQRDPQAAIRWREATRAAFLAALEKGFLVEDLLKTGENTAPRWFYTLTR